MVERSDGIRKGGGASGGRRRAGAQPKGRQVERAALEQVQRLLGERPRRRDLLVEHLHLIQDRYGHLSAAHLAALAHEMRLAQTEVYEVATFYAHFDVVKEGETPPPALTVRVCDSLTCEMMGARQLMAALREGLDPEPGPRRPGALHGPLRHRAGRRGRAPLRRPRDQGQGGGGGPGRAHPCRRPGRHRFRGATSPTAAIGCCGAISGRTRPRSEPDRAVVELLAAMNDSGLRGLGGAGFPTGRKWEFVRKEPKPRYLAVNADEGEPGTFKDRHYLERDPHRFLEGVLIAAWSIEAEAAYIYLRDEYPGIREVLLREIPKVEAAGLAKPGYLVLRRGAGAYICGEESSMLESIEGKRGLPRHRPPYAAQVGLFGRPTLINNVETLYWIRDIVEKGPEWFAAPRAATARRACAATRSPAGSGSPASSSRRPGSPRTS